MSFVARSVIETAGELFKRQPGTCLKECTSLSELGDLGKITTSCSAQFIDSIQSCIDCEAASGFLSPASLQTFKDTIDNLRSTCASIGLPISTASLTTGVAAQTARPPSGSNSPSSSYSGPSPSQTTTATSTGPPIGVIIGGVAGGVVALIGIALLIFFLVRRNRNSGRLDLDENKQIPRPQPYYAVPQSTSTPPPMMQPYNSNSPANPPSPGPHMMPTYNNIGPQVPEVGHYPQYEATPWIGAMNLAVPPSHTSGSVSGHDGQSTYASSSAGSATPFVPHIQLQHDNQQMQQYPSDRKERVITYNPNGPNLFIQQTPSQATSAALLSPTASSPSAYAPSRAPSVSVSQYHATEHLSQDEEPSVMIEPPPYFPSDPAPTSPAAYNQPPLPSGSGTLSANEVEQISRRVAAIMASGGSVEDATKVGKLISDEMSQKREKS